MTFLAVISHSVSITSPISLLERLWIVLIDVTFVPLKGLLVAVRDATFGQVIRRQFERDAIASHHLNPVPPKSSGHGGEDCFACVEFDCKHPSPEFFDHFTHYFD
jgi:hypothetical protein